MFDFSAFINGVKWSPNNNLNFQSFIYKSNMI